MELKLNNLKKSLNRDRTQKEFFNEFCLCSQKNFGNITTTIFYVPPRDSPPALPFALKTNYNYLFLAGNLHFNL